MKIATTSCPNCGYECDETDCVSQPEANPSEGDVSLCINCGSLNKFGPGMIIVACSEKEKMEILDSEHGHLIREAQLLIAGKPSRA